VGNRQLVCGVPAGSRDRVLTARPASALIAFDLDGTLVDSRQDIADAANALLVECGGSPLSEQQIVRMVGEGAAALVARAFSAAAMAPPPDALARFLDLYDARLLNHTRPYEGMADLLEGLRSRVTLGVLTNKPRAATLRILDGLELSQFFARELTFTGDGPHPRKPDPQGLLTLAGLAGTTGAGTMLVGDSIVDWRTAHAAGARACMARYGFGFDSFPPAELVAADLIIDSPGQLAELVY
jgi:phosphoglycolate phosphatase